MKLLVHTVRPFSELPVVCAVIKKGLFWNFDQNLLSWPASEPPNHNRSVSSEELTCRTGSIQLFLNGTTSKIDHQMCRFDEVLLEDSWRGFPLARTLIGIDISAESFKDTLSDVQETRLPVSV